MKRFVLVMFFILLLCFTAGFSNQDVRKATLTLADGTEMSASNIRFEYVGSASQLGIYKMAPSVLNTSTIYYCIEVSKVIVQRKFELSEVESLEIIPRNTSLRSGNIQEFKIKLWSGKKVSIHHKPDGGFIATEVTAEGDEKTFNTVGFLYMQGVKPGEYLWAENIIADAKVAGESGLLKVNPIEIKSIKFEK